MSEPNEDPQGKIAAAMLLDSQDAAEQCADRMLDRATLLEPSKETMEAFEKFPKLSEEGYFPLGYMEKPSIADRVKRFFGRIWNL